MPQDSLFPSLPQLNRLVSLEGNTTATTSMLGALVALNGFTLTFPVFPENFHGVIFVVGAGQVAGEISMDVPAGSFLPVCFLASEIQAMLPPAVIPPPRIYNTTTESWYLLTLQGTAGNEVIHYVPES